MKKVKLTRTPCWKNNVFEKLFEMVQSGKYEVFFGLGNEKQETQESAARVSEVVYDNLVKLGYEAQEIKAVITHLFNWMAHLAQASIFFYQQLQVCISCLNSLYTHLKFYLAGFYIHRKLLFLSISSLAASYVTLKLLLSDEPTSFVKKLVNDEILRGTKLSLAIRNGHAAFYC